MAVAAVVVVSAGLVVACAPEPRPAPPPPTVSSRQITRPTVATTTSLGKANVYRTADGHCFGMDPAQAAERGIQPDPGCAAAVG